MSCTRSGGLWVALAIAGCATGESDAAPDESTMIGFGEDPAALLSALAWPPIVEDYRVQGVYFGYPNGEQAFADLRRQAADHRACDEALRLGPCSSTGVMRWRRFIARARMEDRPSSEFVLQWLNDVVNDFRVVKERATPDIWQTPDEFFAETGVAVDSTLTKYATLKELGIPERDLLIAVGRKPGGAWHAVVLVRDDDGEQERVFALDSVEPIVMDARQLRDGFEPWHVLMERGAFTVRHLIGSTCSADTRGAAVGMALVCDTTVGALGVYTRPCDSTCPGDPRTVCADVSSPEIPGGPGLCLHTPMSGCAEDHEYEVVRRRYDGERAIACVPRTWNL